MTFCPIWSKLGFYVQQLGSHWDMSTALWESSRQRRDSLWLGVKFEDLLFYLVRNLAMTKKPRIQPSTPLRTPVHT